MCSCADTVQSATNPACGLAVAQLALQFRHDMHVTMQWRALVSHVLTTPLLLSTLLASPRDQMSCSAAEMHRDLLCKHWKMSVDRSGVPIAPAMILVGHAVSGLGIAAQANNS